MLNPVTAPAARPLPETRKSSSDDAAPAASAQAGTDATERVDYAELGYYHEHDEIKMRMTNKDGDVFEVRASYDFEAAYAATYTGVKKSGDDAAVLPGEDGPAGHGDMAEWAKNVQKELHKQQRKLLEEAMKGFKSVDAGEGRYVMVVGALYAAQDGSAAKATGDGAAPVPDYWNAENTSDRIVSFATSFAAAHGKDGEAFAKTIKQAVLEGFKQAHAITGELPGAAGKLYGDTKEKVFAKLDKWLDDWKAGGYNQGALSEQSSEPAQAA